MRICKECYNKYLKKDYRKHLHGKNNPFYGKKHQSEFIEHIREINTGNTYAVGIQAPGRGKGRIVSEEGRKNMSLAHKGVKHSLSQKMKIGKATKKNWTNGVFDNSHIGNGKTGYREDIGHFVRSTWEANFARILNYSGIDYEYESKRFDLGDTTYLPDFKVGNIYIEIKGHDTKLAKQKRIMTRNIYGIKIKVIEKIKYLRLQNYYKELILGWE